MTMTKEDRLYSMRMVELAAEAEKLGIKIDKKGSKAKAVEKILAVLAEEETAQTEEAADVTEEATEETAQTEEEATEAPQKKERKPRQKKENPERTAFVDKWLAVVTEKGFVVKSWETAPNLYSIKTVLDTGKFRTVGELRTGLKSWTISLKDAVADEIDLDDYTVTRQKYTLPVIVRADYSEQGNKLFTDFLEVVTA